MTNITMISTLDAAEQLFRALAEQLAAADASYDLVVVGGSAMVDQGTGKHEADLKALKPTPGELLAAARWTRTHDPSAGHRELLANALAYLGVTDVDLGP
jgi:hypothetical protein